MWFELLHVFKLEWVLFCDDDQVRADMLQEKLDALSFTKKKSRVRPTPSVDDPSLTQPLASQSIVAFEGLGSQGAKAAGTLFS